MTDLNKQIVDTQPQTPNLIDISAGVPTGRVQADNSTNILLGNLERLGTQASTIAMSNLVKSNQIRGAMLHETGKLLPEDASYATRTGAQLNKVRLATDSFLTEEKHYIANKGKETNKSVYRARIVDKYEKSVEGLDPAMRNLMDTAFLESSKLLAREHEDAFLRNNRTEAKNTATEVIRGLTAQIQDATLTNKPILQEKLDAYLNSNANRSLSKEDSRSVYAVANTADLATGNNILDSALTKNNIDLGAELQAQRENSQRGYVRLKEKEINLGWTHFHDEINQLVGSGSISHTELDRRYKIAQESNLGTTHPSYNWSDNLTRLHARLNAGHTGRQAEASLNNSYVEATSGFYIDPLTGKPITKQQQSKVNRIYDQDVDKRSVEGARKAIAKLPPNATQEQKTAIFNTYKAIGITDKAKKWSDNNVIQTQYTRFWNSSMNSIIQLAGASKDGKIPLRDDLSTTLDTMIEYEKTDPSLFKKQMSDDIAYLRFLKLKDAKMQGNSVSEAAVLISSAEENPKTKAIFTTEETTELVDDVLAALVSDKESFNSKYNPFYEQLTNTDDMKDQVSGMIGYLRSVFPSRDADEIQALATKRLSTKYEVINNELVLNNGSSFIQKAIDGYNLKYDATELKLTRDKVTNKLTPDEDLVPMLDWNVKEIKLSGQWLNFKDDEKYFTHWDNHTGRMVSFRKDADGIPYNPVVTDLGELLKDYNTDVLIPRDKKRIADEAKNKVTPETRAKMLADVAKRL